MATNDTTGGQAALSERERAARARADELARMNDVLRHEIVERERAEKMASAQAAALTRTLSRLAAEPDLDKFLGHVLQMIAEQFEAQAVSLWLKEGEGTALALHLSYEDGTLRSRLDPDHPLIKNPALARDDLTWLEMVRTRKPVVYADTITDERLTSFRDYFSARGVRTIVGVPLVLADEVIGLIGIRSRELGRFPQSEIDLAQALAQQATLAIQLTRLAERAKQSAVVEERNRMAREIHDTLAQGFIGIIVQLEAAEDVLGDVEPSARAHLASARELARSSLQEARRSVWALRPLVLETSDLPSALQQMLATLTRGTALRTDFTWHGEPAALAPELSSNLLRIGQEAVTNVLSHARASRLTLELYFTPGSVRLCVSDDGVGFGNASRENAATNEQSGFGLISMRERAERQGGQLYVSSTPGQGTRIEAVVPCGGRFAFIPENRDG